MRKAITFALTVCALFAVAQNPIAILGQSLNSDLVQTFVADFGEAEEEFDVNQKKYVMNFPDAGVKIDFNSDMVVYQVYLYDSGFKYKPFLGFLPFKSKWKDQRADLEKVHGMFDISEENPYIGLKSDDYANYTFYFLESALEHIRLTATVSLLEKYAEDNLKLWGFRLLPDGTPVSGDVLAGTGSMRWGDKELGAVYEGEWSYGLPHGTGTYIDSYGNKYYGEFKLGFFWGKGMYESPGQKLKYQGSFLMGRRHGTGKAVWDNGIVYDGLWFQDMMHGQGTYYFNKDYYYVGEMNYNQIQGSGTLSTPSGYHAGSFQEGKPHGKGSQYVSANQTYLNGIWDQGVKNGEFELIGSDGNVRLLKFQNDKEVQF